jgi:hypothetical protein
MKKYALLVPIFFFSTASATTFSNPALNKVSLMALFQLLAELILFVIFVGYVLKWFLGLVILRKSFKVKGGLISLGLAVYLFLTNVIGNSLVAYFGLFPNELTRAGLFNFFNSLLAIIPPLIFCFNSKNVIGSVKYISVGVISYFVTAGMLFSTFFYSGISMTSCYADMCNYPYSIPANIDIMLKIMVISSMVFLLGGIVLYIKKARLRRFVVTGVITNLIVSGAIIYLFL